MKTFVLILILTTLAAANDIIIDAAAGHKAVSPYIFGRNNSISDSKSDPTSAAAWQKYRDAGIKMFRESGGNNSTKYNWRRKLSSHPDWYNNVYSHDWDYAAQSLQDNMPGAKGMWAFQLIGWAAANKNNNFNDWGYNNSQWWEGVRNNWAGGGGPDKGDGDPEKYLMSWPPDSTVAILDHWFEKLGLVKERFRYWNMDNEPEIWMGTHDDVMPDQIEAEEFMQIYFEVAKKARAKFPDIKLLGPTPANEWQWYNWKNEKIRYQGKDYVWLEFFIKRIGEEQEASGIRLLDVLNLHFYPGESSAKDIVDLHRVWFDKTYTYPGANGVKRSGSGGWDDSIRKEYIFERCRVWLDKYLDDHDVSLSVTEMGIKDANANVTAVWYASTLGVFADQGVEIFTPWSWKTGMWEVLHLYSNYTKGIRVSSSSIPADLVNVYASTNATGDSLTLILVNRDTNGNQGANISLVNFEIANGDYETFQLSNLPESETFRSRSNNALTQGSVATSNGSFSLTLPKLSVTAVLLTGKVLETSVLANPIPSNFQLTAYPNPFNLNTTISYCLPFAKDVLIEIYDAVGRRVQSFEKKQQTAGPHSIHFDGAGLANGVYLVRFSAASEIRTKKIMLMK